MVEINHSDSRNFFAPGEFKLVDGLEGLRAEKEETQSREVVMKYFKYLAILAVLMVPLAYSQAQVAVGVGIGVGPVAVGVGPAYVGGPPVCRWGYYDYYPYACAPYGFYGPSYFVDGVFIGAGPWYHWGHPAGFWNRGYYGRGWYGRPGWGYARGYEHGYVRGYEGGH